MDRVVKDGILDVMRINQEQTREEERPSKRARSTTVVDSESLDRPRPHKSRIPQQRQQPGPRPVLPFEVLHHVQCKQQLSSDESHLRHPHFSFYHDQPRLFAKDTGASVLRGSSPIADAEAFLEEAEINGVPFVVQKNYSCAAYHDSVQDKFVCTAPETIDKATFDRLKPWFHVLHNDGDFASVTSEEINILDNDLSRALDDLVARDTQLKDCYEVQESLRAPYDFFYRFLDRLKEILEEDSTKHTADTLAKIRSLLSHIEDASRISWNQATQLFQRQLVSEGNFSKLYYVGDIIVRDQDGLLGVYTIESVEKVKRTSAVIICWTRVFDGGFRRQYQKFYVAMPYDQAEVDLKSLFVWPLRLDSTGLEERLEQRGLQFWRCRRRRLISYQAPLATNFELHLGNPKFMIDIDTHRTLHPNKYPERNAQDYEVVDMSDDKPPAENFALLLPATIPGFGFHDKKWRTLQVDYIQNVVWNEHAFNRLVLKANKKELIQALVTVHLENNQATNVIEGKGAGLIMLLHGPPGTGKTLTAETVSELANKPLYRVTCGDIGTDAEGVEKYLESSLYLGTVWDCVVLLDEADVFLEERTQTDLARNALVSVFLRALEYFNGILILTSNRVGLFDEAFKSRMQLAIHYPSLDEAGRYKIWANFFNALKKADVEMEFDDLSSNVNSLARKDLNGRQIRNVIKTARQLAAFRKQKFGNQHLECALEVMEEFEQYLLKTRGSDAYYAKQQKLRYE